MSHFEGHFEGAKTFLTPFRGQKSRGPLKLSRAQRSGTLVFLCTRVLLCTVVVCCCLLLGCSCVLFCVLLRVRGVGRSP